MPELEVDDGARLHYVERGAGDQTIVFSHSYLVDHHHFEPQLESLAARYRVLAYDHRGHGKSDRPRSGYSMQRIYADGVALLEAVGGGPVHWVGLSTGGFVGMRIAFHRPELLRSLVLMDTSADPEPLLKQLEYRGLFLALRALGTRPVLGAAMRKMFGSAFLADPQRAAARAHWREQLAQNDPRSLIAFGKAIFAREDVSHEVRRIALPTLVLVGEDDRATPPALARRLAQAIPGARLELIPRAGHLCTIEEPDAVNRVLHDFFAAQPPGAASP